MSYFTSLSYIISHFIFFFFFFFFNDTATTEIYTLSLHDALPIYPDEVSLSAAEARALQAEIANMRRQLAEESARAHTLAVDRKSTRLNSSHSSISYAVFCLKKKKKKKKK